MSRTVRRLWRPYCYYRRKGMRRLAAGRRALVTRRSGLGDKGWVPRRQFLSIAPKARHHYRPTIKLWVWRGKTLWTDRREIARQAESASARYEHYQTTPPSRELLAMSKPTDADMEAAADHLRDLGWLQ